MGTLQRIVGAVIVFATVPGVVSGHEIGGRFEAPLPLSFLFGGAAVTVGITALLLTFTVEQPVRGRVPKWQVSISPSIADGLRSFTRAIFFSRSSSRLRVGYLDVRFRRRTLQLFLLGPCG